MPPSATDDRTQGLTRDSDLANSLWYLVFARAVWYKSHAKTAEIMRSLGALGGGL